MHQAIPQAHQDACHDGPATVHSILGDWYANPVPLPFPGRFVVIFTNEPTRLTAIVPGRGRALTVADFQERVTYLLRRLDLPAPCVKREEEALAEVQVAPTVSRSVLGSMNEIALQIHVAAEMSRSVEAFNLERMEMELSTLLHSPLSYRHPIKVARELCRQAR